ncbi:DcrB-related protein [bacterium]|nr:DcrB-related protein [bacterium]
MKKLNIFVFVLSICALFAFPQIASAQWPSDLDGGGGGQQVQQPRQTVNTPKPRTKSPKKAVQSGMIPKSISGINFQFPASWLVNDEATQAPIIFLSYLPSADNSFNDNILICSETLQQQMTCQEYFDLSLQQLQTSIPNFQLINKGKVTIDGYEGKAILYTQNGSGPTIKQQQLYIVVGYHAYVITISSLPNRFEKSVKDAYKLINTITFD